jgi:hypothetical protein
VVVKQHKKTSRFSVKAIISHRYFFVAIVGLFLLHAGWIAFSGNFPLIFDEQYHLGIIEIYSRQISPFITQQPPDAVLYRDITRLPSYLFHWLMSFPFRAIDSFTHDVQTQIIAMRFINIGLVAISLFFWRKLLLIAGFSRTIAHVSLLMFVLIPLVPYTAANINYDNAVLLVLPLVFIAALKTVQPKQNQLKWLLVTVGLGCILSVIKYTMLPALLAIAIFVIAMLAWQHRKKVFAVLLTKAKRLSRVTLAVVVLFAALGASLFVERHAVNLAKYGDVQPNCEQIQPESLCAQNDVWIRNYNREQQFKAGQWELMGPVEFTKERWVPHIFNDLFITAALVGGETKIHQPVPPILETNPGNVVIRNVGWAVFWIGLLLVAVYWRKLPSRRARYLFVGTLLVYGASLWVVNYTGYQRLGVPLATQGRYMIPLLIPAFAIVASAFSYVLKKQAYKTALLIAALVLFTQGAGALTYIHYSWPNWQWQQGPAVELNQRAKDITELFIKT